MNKSQITNKSKINKFFNNPDFWEPFFVGLFEGDGCIYIVKQRKSNALFARLTIGLKYNDMNKLMLDSIQKSFGGSVYKTTQKKAVRVTWSVSNRFYITKILKLFEKYPFLGSRKTCQLDHIKRCLEHNCWDYHLNNRDSKFENQAFVSKRLALIVNECNYFKPWLSGFCEAEASFSSRHRHVVLNIGQNHDAYLIRAIMAYFGSTHSLQIRRVSKHIYYCVDIGGVQCLKQIVNHFKAYPLLGYKQVAYGNFYTQATRIIAKKLC